MIRNRLFFSSLFYLILSSIVIAYQPSFAHENKATINNENNKISSEKDTTQIFYLEIQKRHLLGQLKTIRVTQGDKVRLIWKSDEKVKLHLHGYNLEFELSPGNLSNIDFTAMASGRFAITSHGFAEQKGHGHEALLYLEVHPD